MAAEPLIRRRGRWWVSGSLDVAGQSLARWRSLWLPLLCLSLIWTLVRHPGVTAVAAGIALFLFGMFFMEQGFGQLASARWQQGLRGLTATLPRAFATGFFSTIFTQSSALVALLTLSFLSARMLDVMAGIGIMAGASLGTTSGGWLIATLGLHASPGQLAMPLLVTGMLLISLPRWGLRGGGMALAGIGFMFLGIDYIRQGFSHLADLMSLTRYTLPGMTGMVVYFLGGVALAAALQSSHAALLLIMAALQAGQLDYDNALALVLGINVGATSPVLLGAWHAAHSGRQLALLDTLFKLATALWCLLLFIPLRWVNESLAGACGLGAQSALSLALYHTLFNLLAVAWLLPLRHQAMRWLNRWWPAPTPQPRSPQARYLSRVVAVHPATAQQAMLREVLRLFHHTQCVLARHLLGGDPARQWQPPQAATSTLPAGDSRLPLLPPAYEQHIKPLFGEMLTFVAWYKGNHELAQSARIEALVAIARSLVEAVRQARQLQPGLMVGLESEHAEVRLRYQLLQGRQLALQQQLYQWLLHPEAEGLGEAIAQCSDQITLRARQDKEAIEVLLRGGWSDAVMAATWMNDVQTLRRIQRQQVKAVNRLLELAPDVCQQINQLAEWLQQEIDQGGCDALASAAIPRF